MSGFLDQNARITRITAVSPLARSRMATEGYRTRLTEDEITPETVVELLLEDLVADLYAIGVELHCPLSDLMDTYIHLDYLVAIAAYYLPEPLTQKLKYDCRLRHALETILESGTAAGASVGGVYLQHLGLNEDCHDPNLEVACHWLLDKLVSTAEFIPYVQSLLTISASAAVANQQSDDQLGGYVRYLEVLEHRIEAGLRVLEQYRSLFQDGNALNVIRRRLELYVQALGRPDVMTYMRNILLPASNESVRDRVTTLTEYRAFSQGEVTFIEHYRDNSPSAMMTIVDVVAVLVRTIGEASTVEDGALAVRHLRDALADTSHPPSTSALLTILTPPLLATIPAAVT